MFDSLSEHTFASNPEIERMFLLWGAPAVRVGNVRSAPARRPPRGGAKGAGAE